MHQQRVLAHINQRKREAMTCYTQALTEQPPNVSRAPPHPPVNSPCLHHLQIPRIN